MFRYRNDYDTERDIPDAGLTAKPGEEFDSEFELHNPLLTPIKPAGQVFNPETFRWEARAKVKDVVIPAESERV